MKMVVPSLLSADFGKLEEEIYSVERAGAQRLHLDVMDGHFVPNITIGPFIVEAIRRITSLHLECHLMIDNPEKFIQQFIDAGANTVIVHAEIPGDIHPQLELIKKQGVKAGVVINPPTPLSTAEPYFDAIDHLLIMTVHPGFGGQRIIMEALDKVRQVRQLRSPCRFPLEVDGGINKHTIREVAAAGTNLFVAGSAVFDADDPGKALTELSELIL